MKKAMMDGEKGRRLSDEAENVNEDACGGFICLLLAGCGNTAKPADSGSVVTAGEEEGQMRLRRRMWKKNPVQKNQRKLM